MPQTKSAQLRIVYLIARFHPFKGGAEQNCYQLAKRMAAAGHDVTVLTTDAAPVAAAYQRQAKLLKQETLEGINIIRVHRWNRQLNLGFYPQLLPKLLQIDADVIHYENGPGFIWQEFCLFWKRIVSRKTKFVNTPHGPFLATHNRTGLGKLLETLGRIIMWPYFRVLWPLLFDAVIQVNPQQHKWLRTQYGISIKKIHLVPNGIEANTIIATKPKIAAGEPIVITGVGRIAHYKSFAHIFMAVNIGWLKKIFAKPVKILIMGNQGNAYSELLELRHKLDLEKNSEIIVNPDDDIKNEILTNQSQVHVLPSEWEATGIVLLEAMAKGNAIISSDGNEAARMLIEHRVNGFIYKYGDVQGLAYALSQIVNEPKLLHKMIELNLQKAHTFTWEAIFPKYEKVLASLLKTK